MLLVEAEELRKEHPGCGVEKMYRTLKPDFIGRDRFIDVFMDLGFRLKTKKNYKLAFEIRKELSKIQGHYVERIQHSGEITYKAKFDQ